MPEQHGNTHGETNVDTHAASAEGHAADAAHAVEGATEEIANSMEEHLETAAEHHGRHVSHPPELPHFIQWWFYTDYDELHKQHKNPYGDPKEGLTAKQILHVGRLEHSAPFVGYAPWENNLFAAIGALVLMVIVFFMTLPFRRAKADAMRRPTRIQMLVELVVGGALSFCQGVLGEDNGKRFFPFLATLFFFILTLNLMGMVPLMKAPTSSLLITASLAVTTFFVYLYVGLVKLGPWELFKHLCGSPASAIQWAMAPLMLVIECISFFIAKPLSLALRLYGNILGKDILFGVMLLLGLMVVPGSPMGFPLTFPFYFLGLLLSAIQALVFALLSAIYILMCLPHDHAHEHDHGDGHGHGDGAAHAH